MKTKNLNSLIGISFDGGTLSVVSLRRAGDRLQVRKAFQKPLSLDPLTNDPELVGQEINNQLAEAGIRGNKCIIGVPVKWALTYRTELPDLPEEDIQGYISVQAERHFPFSPSDLSISESRYRTSNTSYTTVTAVPLNYLNALQKVFKSARLQPVSITLGLAGLYQPAGTSADGRIDMLVTDRGIDLQIQAGGGVVALRTLEEHSENELNSQLFDIDSITRQIRITLGQLPADIRASIRTVRLYGKPRSIEPLFDEFQDSMNQLGLTLEVGAIDKIRKLVVPNDITSLPPTALGITAQFLLSRSSVFEFLPPRVNRFQQMAGQFTSKGFLWLGGTAATLIIVSIAAFFYQYWRLSSLDSRWDDIKYKVAEVEELQNQIRTFRPWFDESIQNLLIVRELTKAFPEEGSVWIKTFEIKDQSEISCSGFAKRNQDLLDLHERLRKTPGIVELKVRQFRGESPLQFSLNYQWKEGLSDGV